MGGIICEACVNSEGLDPYYFDTSNIRARELRQCIDLRKQYRNEFSKTKNIGYYLWIDEGKHLVKVGRDYFKFEDILSYELVVDGETLVTSSNAVGRAIVGGIAFGIAGAIIGAATRGANTKKACSDMHITIGLNRSVINTAYIRFISDQTDRESTTYQDAQKSADACLALLKSISVALESENSAPITTESSPVSAADEILKFKQLLDANIITQEEFEAKKKQLLGL